MRLLQTGDFAGFAFFDEAADQDIEHRSQQQAEEMCIRDRCVGSCHALGDLMDIWMAFQALILGVVEGLTEFLPISSTGHLIVVGDLLGFNGDEATAFKIIIQLGAILAVIWEFRAKVLGVVVGLPSDPKAQRFTFNLLLAFIPAVIFGLAFADLIEHWLFNPCLLYTSRCV